MTLGEAINAAYRKIGVTNLTTTDMNNGLEAFNNLVSLWSIEDIFPYVSRESLTLTSGSSTYTVGSGGNFNTTRPVDLKNAYLRDTDGNDYPLAIMSWEEYNDIVDKTQTGRPEKIYFLPEYPLAKIIFDYVPDEAYVAYFEFGKPFSELESTSSSISLPDEYKMPIIYNLAIALADDKLINVSNTVLVMAEYSKNLLSRAFASRRITPKAKFDINTGRNLNIETDS